MNVIEFKQNLNDELVAFENGVELSSFADSSEQGEVWASKIQDDRRRIVVVGIGSGYQIAALAATGRFEKIDVVDCRAPLVGGFFRRFPELAEIVTCHHFETEDAALNSFLMEEVIEENISIHLFSPCFGEHTQLLESFVRLLTGRSAKSLEKVLKHLGMNLSITETQTESQRWLSIKDVGFYVDAAHVGHPSASAIRILRELLV